MTQEKPLPHHTRSLIGFPPLALAYPCRVSLAGTFQSIIHLLLSCGHLLGEQAQVAANGLRLLLGEPSLLGGAGLAALPYIARLLPVEAPHDTLKKGHTGLWRSLRFQHRILIRTAQGCQELAPLEGNLVAGIYLLYLPQTLSEALNIGVFTAVNNPNHGVGSTDDVP